MRYWNHYHYTPVEPKEVKDGIKLQSRNVGSTWWSQCWIKVLDSFGWENRLARGRRYAKRGQVVNFKLEKGEVTAQVQGTQAKPYSVTIKLKVLSKEEWNKVLTKMSEQAQFAANLLVGEMPEDIEKVFTSAKVPLFPTSKKDFVATCSCPDWANPCKHIAAVHYILAEEFDRDPFMIFKLRGLTKERLIDELNKRRTIQSEKTSKETTDEVTTREIDLSRDLDKFFTINNPEKFNSIRFNITQPDVQLSLLRRLGEPPFWRAVSRPNFFQEMEKIYKIISEYGIRLKNEK
ncbi:MAG: hypothetical protein COS84_00505 [Armatimonadetes bacterium CG07_land_8_20_14_0_80_40_9]|nr:MAG: hypothetical protein COS84_00505 [Armatimonadetes bacterium CG07_land_8_20_14_0_80_40_9]